MNTQLKSSAEKRRLKEQKILVNAGSDPKQKNYFFQRKSQMLTRSSSIEDKVPNVIISTESEVKLIINYNNLISILLSIDYL